MIRPLKLYHLPSQPSQWWSYGWKSFQEPSVITHLPKKLMIYVAKVGLVHYVTASILCESTQIPSYMHCAQEK